MGTRERYFKDSSSVNVFLVLINPNLSEVIRGSMCHWFATAYLHEKFYTLNTHPLLKSQS